MPPLYEFLTIPSDNKDNSFNLFLSPLHLPTTEHRSLRLCKISLLCGLLFLFCHLNNSCMVGKRFFLMPLSRHCTSGIFSPGFPEVSPLHLYFCFKSVLMASGSFLRNLISSDGVSIAYELFLVLGEMIYSILAREWWHPYVV